MATLALVRHGESVWNQKGLWTGLTDIALSEKGIEEAKKAGETLKNINFDIGFTSVLMRAKQTIEEIKKILHQDFPVIENKELNEKDYGKFTGKNKWEVKKEVGEEEFIKIRRGWDYQIPEGESLKDVYERVVPYYQNSIFTELKTGKNVLVAAHGNSLRALIKYLENIPDEQIPGLELRTGEIYIYNIDQNGKVLSKEIKH